MKNDNNINGYLISAYSMNSSKRFTIQTLRYHTIKQQVKNMNIKYICNRTARVKDNMTSKK